ncbi:serine/threonine-protein kinase grp-like [Oratosquilla oratoria]|uniref:serine/threonine-protein kinase grp-like n=1 Tax=Oratosquilla oratoria TaxID=337810 RepID=UPI003F776237
MIYSSSTKLEEEEERSSGGSSRRSSVFAVSSVEEYSQTEDSSSPVFKRRKRALSSTSEEEEKCVKKSKSFEKPKEDWIEVTKLGEGAYGVVVLLKKATSGDLVVKKSIEIEDELNHETEVQVQARLQHRNILRVLCSEKDKTHVHIYLEYASGGDLSRKIGPSGLDKEMSIFYFKQLVSGVKYMHTHRVVHRDLKLSNLLLDSNDVVKIADFGLSAKLEDRETYLSKVCGTRGYMAPEVFSARYKGEASDVWSCGVILVKMLSGRAPWKVAKTYDLNYQLWLQKDLKLLDRKPWTDICKSAMDLIKSLLNPDPSGRATIEEIEQHDFVAN